MHARRVEVRRENPDLDKYDAHVPLILYRVGSDGKFARVRANITAGQ